MCEPSEVMLSIWKVVAKRSRHDTCRLACWVEVAVLDGLAAVSSVLLAPVAPLKKTQSRETVEKGVDCIHKTALIFKQVQRLKCLQNLS